MIRLNAVHVVGAVLALLIAMLAIAHAHDYELGKLHIEHPWARASAGAAPTGAAYLAIENRGDAPDRLIGAATPAAERAELHNHIDDNGVMKMREVEGGIVLPAGTTTQLAPGGLHIMLMGLAQPLEAGTHFPLTLTFEKAGELAVEIKVEPIGHQPEPAHGHAHQ